MSATYDPTRPAPETISATNVGDVPDDNTGLIYVDIEYVDNAEGEALTSAYFTSSDHAAATQNIFGPPEASGNRVARIIIGGYVQRVKLRHMWGTFPGTGEDIVWGPFGNEVPVLVSSTATKPGKGQGGKGHNK